MLMGSSAHLVDGLFKRTAADFVQNRALNDLGPFENCLKYISLELEPNFCENLKYLILGPGSVEILIFHSERAKLFWEQKFDCGGFVSVVLNNIGLYVGISHTLPFWFLDVISN